MKQNVSKKIISLVLSALFFFVLAFTMFGSTYSSLAMLFGKLTMEVPIFMYGFPLIVSGVFYVNIYQLLTNKMNISFLRIEMIVYLVLLFAIIMLKSRGFQAINLDFTDLYQSLIEYPASVIVNFLLFIPLGAFTLKYIKSVPKALIFCTGFHNFS